MGLPRQMRHVNGRSAPMKRVTGNPPARGFAPLAGPNVYTSQGSRHYCYVVINHGEREPVFEEDVLQSKVGHSAQNSLGW